MQPTVQLVLDLDVSPVEYDTRRASRIIADAVSATVTVEGLPPVTINLADASTWFMCFNLIGFLTRELIVVATGSGDEVVQKVVRCSVQPPNPAIKEVFPILFKDHTWSEP